MTEENNTGLETADLPQTAVRTAPPLDGQGRPSVIVRHDVVVAIVALGAIAIGASAYRALATPALSSWTSHGLRVSYPETWFAPRPVPPDTDPLARGNGTPSGHPPDRLHVVIESLDPLSRIEIQIDPKPVYRNWRGALSLFRVARYGDTYWTKHSLPIKDGAWIQTEFRYAFAEYAGASPRVATGIEYAALRNEQLYRVTFHGDAESAKRLADALGPSIAWNEEP